MSTVTIDTHAAVKKLIGVELSEAQAEAIVHVLASVNDGVATKRDLAGLSQDLKSELELLRRDLTIKMWTVGAAVVAILSALRYFG